ncbi:MULTISPECIES: hypothetical protein [unclassified Caballeronia]|uniref:hypothetical protein n=1 Tax=unclassified Caballeronia TaxID=2646786 RepID=UPI0013EDE271|nr:MULTISPECIES: hypothetical protein [unclassified Caballeronia]
MGWPRRLCDFLEGAFAHAADPFAAVARFINLAGIGHTIFNSAVTFGKFHIVGKRF